MRVIVGPTAAGKSAIAMHLAERYHGALISADSRQIYTGFDIGTAKPSADDRRRVPHYGIDIADPTERYSAHQWAEQARQWMTDAYRHGREPLVVGGTGFYVRALVHPLDPVPPLDPAQRRVLEVWLDGLDPATLARWCARLDPARAALGRTQQLRAVETALLSGTRLSHWHGSLPAPSGIERIRYLVVDPGAMLAARIAARVEAMVAHGWLDEIRALQQQVPASAPAWKASGYGTMAHAVAGTITVAEAVQRVTIETRQYAKRQRTWNRNQLPAAQVTHLDSGAPDALDQACDWWERTVREPS